MIFNLEESELYKNLILAEKLLLKSPKIKFERTLSWRTQYFKRVSGIYVLFEANNNIIYIGETGNLYKRMSDITRTVNHTFRKQIGNLKFGGNKSRKKYDLEIEAMLDKYFDEELFITYIEVNFGRLEIETYLIDKYQNQIINSTKKRKFLFNYDLIADIEKQIIS
ncbi:GIY-YIG nuclease family protein [Elizabethkingia miricola]|uniref:GIY-YIG nuclease family protein n=1 Tax=Elizabethkingia miricola TaxID=172045 RepID=UPI00389185B6